MGRGGSAGNVTPGRASAPSTRQRPPWPRDECSTATGEINGHGREGSVMVKRAISIPADVGEGQRRRHRLRRLIPLGYIAPSLLALLLNTPVWGRGFFRAALLIPWVIPPIVSIVSWRWMLDQSGLINSVLTALGLQPIYFLSSEFWARVSVIVVKIWVSFPFMLVTLLAALQAISQDLYEAAALDGCGRWSAFRYITVPHLKMVTLISWILMTIYSVNDFPTIWLLTQGGPVNATQSLIVLAFKYAFQVSNVGLGAAVSVIAMLGMLVLG